jgi:hypothetical protein
MPLRVQGPAKEGHETGEAEEQGSRALKSQIRPVALRLDTHMGAPFLTRCQRRWKSEPVSVRFAPMAGQV